jgi:hypothetical protein
MLRSAIIMMLAAGISVTAATKTKKNEKSEKPKLQPMKIKNSGFQQVDDKGNPARKTWWKSWHVHDKTKPNAMKLQREGYKYITQTTVKVKPEDKKDTDRCAKIVTPVSVNKLRNEKGEPMVSNGFAQTIAVKGGGNYTLTFNLKGQLYKAPGFNNFVVVADFLGGNKVPWKCKRTGKSFVKRIKLPPAWQGASLAIKVPDGTNFICLYLKIYGCGEAYYDNIGLVRN